MKGVCQGAHRVKEHTAIPYQLVWSQGYTVGGWELTSEGYFLMSTLVPYQTHPHIHTHKHLINKAKT